MKDPEAVLQNAMAASLKAAQLDERNPCSHCAVSVSRAFAGHFEPAIRGGEGELACGVDGHEEAQLALAGLHLGDVKVEVADRMGGEALLRGLFPDITTDLFLLADPLGPASLG